MKNVKVKKDFIKLEKEYVLPMNIQEVWDLFFNDDAKSPFVKAEEDLGDKFTSIGKWKEYTKKHDGENSLKHRKVTSIAKLPSNAMSTTINNERNSYLLKLSDTELVIED